MSSSNVKVDLERLREHVGMAVASSGKNTDELKFKTLRRNVEKSMGLERGTLKEWKKTMKQICVSIIEVCFF